ncbi:hypothetical protein ACIRPT_35445 [Streptomyces sp. NPDC101227]
MRRLEIVTYALTPWLDAGAPVIEPAPTCAPVFRLDGPAPAQPP